MQGLLIFLLLLFPPQSFADHLDLLIYRAPEPLNWQSPGRLVRSMTRNLNAKVDGKDYPHPISHVNIRLQCGRERPVYRGMTSIKSNGAYLWDFLVKGVSLDTMLINQTGRSYSEQEILSWLKPLIEKGYARQFRLILNSDQCARLRRYVDLYHTTGLINIYGGLRSDPLLGQGAGCSAFAVSFLRILGLDSENLRKAWQRKLRIPLELLSVKHERARISFLGYLRGQDRPWASTHEEHIVLNFWDPEKMFHWVGDPYREWDVRGHPAAAKPLLPWSREVFKNTVQYHFDNRRRLLTKEEVQNTSSKTCRNFQKCP
ncbi:hypothetical protein Bb109J_c1675 [Bdellovibrio bacteriovorus]|uniref:hypothetical protein n=1 Tax=Bdellovibrio bacteriovorus TaxID=959 RepID=UPI00045BE5AC|nr:hypothetical protein EP01_05380 [Bdellovibrio bacteriovorus]BEV68255.1 hypothetical protein Bb109J_c1675 [Bdellovibrio bacteriovorus]